MLKAFPAIVVTGVLLAACGDQAGSRSSGLCGGAYGYEPAFEDCDPEYAATLKRVRANRYFPSR